jgi:hypothetical protein
METLRLQKVSGTLTEEEQAAFDSFFQLCHQKKLTQSPEGLQPDDLVDGLSDERTLL